MILQYMRKYPSFYFRSTKLSRVLDLSSYRISKLLLEMHDFGLLERFTRGHGIHTKSYYKAKK